jgi:tetratricopeptide (TPR) repeat protein
MTQNNLAIAYRNLSEVENRADNLHRAIAAYEQALQYRTPQAAPLDWVMTQTNLRLVLWNMDDRAGACAAWAKGERYYRQMGDVEQADAILAHMRRKSCGR